MVCKLSDRVNNNGEITTLADLLDDRRAFVEKIDDYTSGNKPAYFVMLVEYVNGTPQAALDGWRIGQKAYESRVAKGYTLENIPHGYKANVRVKADSGTIIVSDGYGDRVYNVAQVFYEGENWHEINAIADLTAQRIADHMCVCGYEIHSTDQGIIAFSYPHTEPSGDCKYMVENKPITTATIMWDKIGKPRGAHSMWWRK